MRDELLESANQLVAVNWLQPPAKQFLRAKDQDHSFPVTDMIGTRLPPGAK
jgi:hypothetical protein